MVKIIEPSFEILTDIEVLNPLKMIEIAARTCYQSWDYMQEGSAEKLVKHMLYDYTPPHYAMIEHGGMISVRFIVSRSFTHQVVRHRLASYAQESQRFVDYVKEKHGEGLTIIKPIECPLSIKHLNEIIQSHNKNNKFNDVVIFDEIIKEYGRETCEIWILWIQLMIDSEKTYFGVRKHGIKPEIARTVLPIGIKSEIVVSTNLREWHHIFKLRTAPGNHPLIRTLMRGLLKEFKQRIPIIFNDLLDYDD